MKEPKSKKLVLTALIVCILFVIITLVSVAYLAGRDVANQDSSAAVEGPVTQEPTDGIIELDFPSSIAQNAKYSVGMTYYGEVDTNDLPDWNINVCGKSRTFDDAQWVSFTQNFAKSGNCAINITVRSIGETETLNTSVFVHKLTNTVTNNKIVLNTEWSNSVVGVSNVGKAKRNYENTQWRWSTKGDCSIIGENGFTLGLDSVTMIRKSTSGDGTCTVKYTGYSFYSATVVKLVGQKKLSSGELESLSTATAEDASYEQTLSDFLMTEDSADDSVEGSICGAIDENQDGRLNIIDYVPFAQIYGRGGTICADTSIDYGVCGAKDYDSDGKLNINDLLSFVGRYVPSPTCAL